jgi:hypothetical protein
MPLTGFSGIEMSGSGATWRRSNRKKQVEKRGWIMQNGIAAPAAERKRKMPDQIQKMLISGTWNVHVDADLLEGNIVLSLILAMDSPLKIAEPLVSGEFVAKVSEAKEGEDS